MAHRINYFLILKQIHLISSFVLLGFIVVFLLTGIVIVNRKLFDIPETSEKEKKIAVDRKMTGTPSEYSDYLKKSLNLKGRQLWQKQENNGNWTFRYNFQGKNHAIVLTPKQDSLLIRTNEQKMNLLTVSTKIHHLRGFKGGWEYTLWAIFYDITAVSFVIFALTGLLMWIRLKMRYPNGFWYLLAGLVMPVIFVLIFLFWK